MKCDVVHPVPANFFNWVSILFHSRVMICQYQRNILAWSWKTFKKIGSVGKASHKKKIKKVDWNLGYNIFQSKSDKKVLWPKFKFFTLEWYKEN